MSVKSSPTVKLTLNADNYREFVVFYAKPVKDSRFTLVEKLSDKNLAYLDQKLLMCSDVLVNLPDMKIIDALGQMDPDDPEFKLSRYVMGVIQFIEEIFSRLKLTDVMEEKYLNFVEMFKIPVVRYAIADASFFYNHHNHFRAFLNKLYLSVIEIQYSYKNKKYDYLYEVLQAMLAVAEHPKSAFNSIMIKTQAFFCKVRCKES
jgi:hypothetical protein